jgi:hypothetical protein
MPLELPVLPAPELPVDGLLLDGLALLELEVPPLLELDPLLLCSLRQRSFSAPVMLSHWALELPALGEVVLGDVVDDELLPLEDGEAGLTPDPDDWANEAADIAHSAAAVAMPIAFNIVASPM